jgi:uncharacterized membrane protein
MKTERIASLLLALLGIGLVVQAAFYLPRLPDRIASHFDFSGRPNGWMSRTEFMVFTAIMLVALYFVFGAMPALLAKLPDWMINMPRKDYWLAPEHKTESLAYLRTWMRWFGCLTLLMLLAIFELVFRANLSAPPLLDSSAAWIIVAYLALLIASVIPALLRFRVPRPDH